jgi:hypothetical protein
MITITTEAANLAFNKKCTVMATFECPNCNIDVCFYTAPPVKCILCRAKLPDITQLLNYPVRRIQWHMGDYEL